MVSCSDDPRTTLIIMFPEQHQHHNIRLCMKLLFHLIIIFTLLFVILSVNNSLYYILLHCFQICLFVLLCNVFFKTLYDTVLILQARLLAFMDIYTQIYYFSNEQMLMLNTQIRILYHLNKKKKLDAFVRYFFICRLAIDVFQ